MYIKPDLPCDNQLTVSKQTTTSRKGHQGVNRLTRSCQGRWKKHRTKYTYDFKADGTNLTGRAVGIRDNGTNDVAITDGKINLDEITFVEPLSFNGNDVRIEYTGKVSGDEIKMHRKVGDFAEEDLVAKRVKDGDTQPAATTDTNSPPAKP